jgi:ABC-2 type transport system ATP-binding protein
MEEAERLADRVGLLADGRLVAVDSPAALIEEYGGESLLRVEGEFDGEVTAGIEYPAELGDGRLTVRNVPPEEIGTVVDALAGAGVEYESLTWTEPDLEDVYLELTGQAVGAGGEAVSDERRGRREEASEPQSGDGEVSA